MNFFFLIQQLCIFAAFLCCTQYTVHIPKTKRNFISCFFSSSFPFQFTMKMNVEPYKHKYIKFNLQIDLCYFTTYNSCACFLLQEIKSLSHFWLFYLLLYFFFVFLVYFFFLFSHSLSFACLLNSILLHQFCCNPCLCREICFPISIFFFFGVFIR